MTWTRSGVGSWSFSGRFPGFPFAFLMAVGCGFGPRRPTLTPPYQNLRSFFREVVCGFRLSHEQKKTPSGLLARRPTESPVLARRLAIVAPLAQRLMIGRIPEQIDIPTMRDDVIDDFCSSDQ